MSGGELAESLAGLDLAGGGPRACSDPATATAYIGCSVPPAVGACSDSRKRSRCCARPGPVRNSNSGANACWSGPGLPASEDRNSISVVRPGPRRCVRPGSGTGTARPVPKGTGSTIDALHVRSTTNANANWARERGVGTTGYRSATGSADLPADPNVRVVTPDEYVALCEKLGPDAELVSGRWWAGCRWRRGGARPGPAEPVAAAAGCRVRAGPRPRRAGGAESGDAIR